MEIKSIEKNGVLCARRAENSLDLLIGGWLALSEMLLGDS